MKKVTFTILFLFFCVFSYTQKSLTLDSCIALALEHSTERKNALLKVDMARLTKKEAFTNYFPQISANLMGFQTQFQGYLSPDLEITINDYTPSTPTSSTVSMDYSFIKKGFLTGVSAVQPIFVGGQIFYGNKLANIGLQAERLQVSLNENEIRKKVEEYFWLIVSLEEKLKTINTISLQLDKIYKDVEVSVTEGIINQNDFLKVQLKQQEVLSGKLQIENGIRITKHTLKQYINLKEQDFTLSYDSLALPDPPDKDYINPEEAVSQRLEIQLLDCQKKVANYQTKMEVGKRLPTLAVGAAVIYLGMTNSQNKAGFIYGTLSVPISDWWGGSYAIKKQKLQAKINENNYTNTLELLTLQTEQAWNEVNEAYMQLQISQLAIKQANDYLRVSSDSYDSGVISLSGLLDAQSTLQQKQNDYLDAYIDYFQKRTAYLQLVGK
ncbi:MAG: TolC family protein [Bacteroidales bacterium]|nr:TolC family protein [Bacteroidales bacterium]